jgi:hypothetical protein
MCLLESYTLIRKESAIHFETRDDQRFKHVTVVIFPVWLH